MIPNAAMFNGQRYVDNNVRLAGVAEIPNKKRRIYPESVSSTGPGVSKPGGVICIDCYLSATVFA